MILGYHSCDKSLGLKILNGEDQLKPSTNTWDWLGDGVYFWEQSPDRALQYAQEVHKKKQFAKAEISEPFVIGAILDLGLCLNLVEPKSMQILKDGFDGLASACEKSGSKIPINDGANRALDCAVIKYIHQSNKNLGANEFDSVRGAFPEGNEIYPGAEIRSRTHIQIAIRNVDRCIRGYFLPRPVGEFNPSMSYES